MSNSILAQAVGKTFWMPEQASTVAAEVDWMFYVILYVCYFFFFLIVVMMLGFLFKYRYRKGAPEHPAPPGHSLALEMLWTIPPTIILLLIAWRGFRGFMDMTVAPPNSYEVQVNGQMWNWAFMYPNGVTPTFAAPSPNELTIPELHVWKDQPIRLVLNSTDVIHSFYIPAFRVKKDVVPGRFNKMWFQATKAGEYPVYCAEYCGISHSEMRAKVVVHPNKKMFDDWLAEASIWLPKMTYQERGRILHGQYCSSCHSIDGSKNTGPSWKNLYGEEQAMADGSKAIADEEYVRESIYYPQKRIVAGYPAGQMNSFLGQLAEDDVRALTWYMKSISDNFDKSLLPTKNAAETDSAGAGTPPATDAPNLGAPNPGAPKH